MGFIGLDWYKNLARWDGNNFSPLDVPRAMLQELGNPQDSYVSIHIAGTNGKGSVAFDLESILIQSKKWNKVAKTISPHLLSITESSTVNGEESSLEEIDSSLRIVKGVAEKLGLQVTQYAALLIASFYIFRDKGVDIAIVEAGLGGRFDATNVLGNKILNIITSISFDHEFQLGNTLQEIAWHKSGIIITNVPTVVGEVASEVLNEIDRNASFVNSEVIALDRDYFRKGDRVRFRGLDENLRLHEIEPEYKLKNREVSIVASSVLGVSNESIEEGLRNCHCPGRFEFYQNVGQKSIAVIDVAHNPDGVRELFSPRCIEYYKSFKYINVIFTLLKRKNWQEMMLLLINKPELNYKLILLSLSEDHVNESELRKEFPHSDFKAISTMQDHLISDSNVLNLFFGSTTLYSPFICWAHSQKLSRANGHLA